MTFLGDREILNEWKWAIDVSMHRVKDSIDGYNNYRGINLLSVPGKVYGRALTGRLMEITEGKVSGEQVGFREGKGCMDQIFPIKMMVEYSRKSEILYTTFIGLEKTYYTVDREALLNVLKIYGGGGQLLGGIKIYFHRRQVQV